MSLSSACRGSTTAPPLPSFQPSSEGQPRPTCDEVKEQFSTPAYNHIPRPLLEFMAFSRADIQLDSEPTTIPHDRHEVANKPGGRAGRNRDTVEVWLLGHRSTNLNLHRSEFDHRTRGDNSNPLLAPSRPPLMCNTILSRTSTSSSQYSAVSSIFDAEASCTTESETDLSPTEYVISTNKPSTKLKSHVELKEKSESSSSSSGDDQAEVFLPKRHPRRAPSMSIHDKLRAGMYTTVPLTPDNLQRYMSAYAVQRPSSSRSRRPRSEAPSQPATQSNEGKSGWERMKESVRRMEREAAAREKEKESGVAKWRVGVSNVSLSGTLGIGSCERDGLINF